MRNKAMTSDKLIEMRECMTHPTEGERIANKCHGWMPPGMSLLAEEIDTAIAEAVERETSVLYDALERITMCRLKDSDMMIDIAQIALSRKK